MTATVLDPCCGPRMWWFDNADPRTLKIVTKAEREPTPPALAAWLVELARRTRVVEEMSA